MVTFKFIDRHGDLSTGKPAPGDVFRIDSNGNQTKVNLVVRELPDNKGSWTSTGTKYAVKVEGSYDDLFHCLHEELVDFLENGKPLNYARDRFEYRRT